MKVTVVVMALSAVASVANAYVVIWPVFENQIVNRIMDDCFFGVATPKGCGCV